MPHQPVRRLLHIIPRRPHRIVQIRLVHAPGVVPPERLVPVAVPLEQLLQPVPVARPRRAVPHHLQDAARRVLRIELGPVVRLHEPRVAHPVVRRHDPRVPAGLLHDDAQDAPHVHPGLPAHRLDGRLDEADLRVRRVEAHQSAVLRP